MYEGIVDGLIRINRIELSKRDYAESLKPAARALWASYQRGGLIERYANYSDSQVKAAYFLRYFPYYTQIIPSILEAHPDVAPYWYSNPDIVFFGPGPGPELVGLAQYFAKLDSGVVDISAHMYDLHDWKIHCEEITRPLACSALENLNLNYFYKTVDFSKPDAITEEIAARIKDCELVTFQNCINEVERESVESVVNNVSVVFRNLKVNASIIVSGRGNNYATANLILGRVMESVSDYASASERGAKTINCRLIDRHMPDYILGNMLHRNFVDGLTLPRDFPYEYLIAKRNGLH